MEYEPLNKDELRVDPKDNVIEEMEYDAERTGEL